MSDRKRAIESSLVSICVLGLAVVYWVQNPMVSYPDAFFEKGVLAITALLAAYNVARSFVSFRRIDRTSNQTDRKSRKGGVSPLVVGLGATILFFGAIFVLGFYVSVACFLFGMYGFVGVERKQIKLRYVISSAGAAVAVAIGLYVVFTVLLGVQPPISLLAHVL